MRWLAAKAKSLARADALIRRNPLYYRRALNLLARAQQMDEAQRRAWLDQRVNSVLRAARHTRYGAHYAHAYRLEDWPLLHKESLRRSVDDFQATRSFLAVAASTSGSSGQPLSLRRSYRSVAFEQAVVDSILVNVGLNPMKARIAVLRGDYVKKPDDLSPPFWKASSDERRLVLSSFHLCRDTSEHYWKALESFRADVLLAYPSALDALVELLRCEDRILRIPLVITSSEVLPRGSWDLARERLGCQLVDRYGQAERVAEAEARAPDRYYFTFGYAAVELQHRTGDDLFDYHEIIGTPLWNMAMPLVRYCTGDLLRVPRGTNARTLEKICLGMEPFHGIEGRTSDYLLSPEGVRLIAMNHLPRDLRQVRQMQLVQELPDRVIIRVVPQSHFSAGDVEATLRAARLKIPRSIHLSVEVVDALERGPGGKVPFIVRHGAASARNRIP